MTIEDNELKFTPEEKAEMKCDYCQGPSNGFLTVQEKGERAPSLYCSWRCLSADSMFKAAGQPTIYPAEAYRRVNLRTGS